jgi:hypothetical protein
MPFWTYDVTPAAVFWINAIPKGFKICGDQSPFWSLVQGCGVWFDAFKFTTNKPQDWRKQFSSAVAMYVHGNWEDASRRLKGGGGGCGITLLECLVEIPEDRPSQILLEFMARWKFCAPNSWRGFRELTEK